MKIKVILIGNSTMLKNCINYAIKYFSEIFVITNDNQIKKNFKKKVRFIKFNQLHEVKADYLFSILNERILSPKQLKSIREISINFHDGPLPKYAGLFSSSWAIYYKEKKKHGVCWHKIDNKIDTGDILLEKKFNIESKDTSYSIDAKGIKIGFSLFKNLINKIAKGKINFKKQNLKKRSYFNKKKLHLLLKKFLKNKENKILARSFSLSFQKYELIQKLFKINLKKQINALSKKNIHKYDVNNFKTKKF